MNIHGKVQSKHFMFKQRKTQSQHDIFVRLRAAVTRRDKRIFKMREYKLKICLLRAAARN